MSSEKIAAIVRHILYGDTTSPEYSQTILDFSRGTQRSTLLRLAIEKRLKAGKIADLEYLRALLCISSNPQAAAPLVECLEEEPSHPATLPSKLTLQADLNIALKDYNRADTLLSLAINNTPKNWFPYGSFANLRFLQAKLDGLDDCLQEGLIAFPHSVQLFLLRIDLLGRLKRIEEAIQLGQEALRRVGEHPRIYSAIASYLTAQGKADESIEYLVYALSIEPEDAYCLAMLGDALASLNRPLEAIQLYERALVFRKWSDLFNRIGVQLGILQRPDLQIIAISQGLALDKNNQELWRNIANAFAVCGEPLVAIEILEKILSQSSIPWSFFTQIQFNLSIQGEWALEKLSHYGRLYWSKACNSTSISLPKTNLAATCRPLRIGFLSADIGDHVVGRFIKSMLSGRSESFNIDIISTQRRFDSASLAISLTATHAYSTQGLSAREARDLIKAEQYDILVDTNGYTKHSGIGLLSDRCAPIQCHYIGYHASTYAPFIDYFIADQVLAPKGSDCHFTEKLYRLSRTWLALSPDYLPDSELIHPRPKPCSSTIFGSFCQALKISDQTLEIWSQVLTKVPNSKLLIKSLSLTDPLKEKIVTTLEQQNISTSRISFIATVESYLEHLKLYNKIDIALDTSPWSSATTCFEALSMGVPLVAFTGSNLASRMSTSVVNGGGLGSYAASNVEDYANLCHYLSEEIQSRRISKESIRKQVEASELYDNSDLARHLELAFINMHSKLVNC